MRSDGRTPPPCQLTSDYQFSKGWWSAVRLSKAIMRIKMQAININVPSAICQPYKRGLSGCIWGDNWTFPFILANQIWCYNHQRDDNNSGVILQILTNFNANGRFLYFIHHSNMSSNIISLTQAIVQMYERTHVQIVLHGRCNWFIHYMEFTVFSVSICG